MQKNMNNTHETMTSTAEAANALQPFLFDMAQFDAAAESEEQEQVVLPPLPRFAAAEPVDRLNSKAEDLQAAMTRRGEHVFLASDRDRSRKVGFGVYLSRVVNGEVAIGK